MRGNQPNCAAYQTNANGTEVEKTGCDLGNLQKVTGWCTVEVIKIILHEKFRFIIFQACILELEMRLKQENGYMMRCSLWVGYRILAG